MRALSIFVLGTLILASDLKAAEGDSKILGSVDIRPTWTTKQGSVGTENVITGGYQFSPDLQLLYTQFFVTNLFSRKGDDAGLDLAADYGLIRLKLNNLYVSPDEKFSVSYEPRIYLPTLRSARDNGMIIANRNYIKFRYQATDSITLSVHEIPIFHVFSRAGNVSADDTASANPVFENRVYFLADFKLASKLTLSMNLLFHQTRNRAYSDRAENDDKWTFVLWTYPELTYSLTDKSTLGLAFYSGNLVSSNLDALPLGDGLESGAVQVSFATSI